MEKAAAIFISIMVVASTALAGLGYLYFSDSQEAYIDNSDDDSTTNSTPDTTPDPTPDPIPDTTPDPIPDTTPDPIPDTTPDPEPDNSNLPLAPDFNLPKVGGGFVRLSSLRGQVVILDFMATWCGPCETELAHLDEIYNSYSSSQIEILSIDVDISESESLLSIYADNHDIPWDILMDTSGINNAVGYDVSSIPTLVIVDQDGRIAYRAVGVTSASTLQAEINSLL